MQNMVIILLKKYHHFFKKIKQNDKKLKKYNQRIYDKIKHKVNDLHWKLAKELATNYDTVIIGNMSTKGIVKGDKLQGITKNVSYMAAHFTFRQRLKSKCEEYGTTFVEADESYTSKTCGKCGIINENLGSSKSFNCSCGFTLDRDVNGARNILIKTKKSYWK